MSDDRLTRAEKRAHGERSARLARTLMTLKDHELRKLNLDDDVLEEVEGARAIKSMAARRREERRLGGVIRDAGMEDIEGAIAHLDDAKHDEARAFQRAERWRKDLLSGGPDALARFFEAAPNADRDEVTTALDEAVREENTGKPRGAKKRLFRVVRDAIDA